MGPTRADGADLKYLPYQATFDGCQYGLKDQQDKPICKPWRVQANWPDIANKLNKRCKHDHEHGDCVGATARDSAFYTHALVADIMKAILEMHGDGLAPVEDDMPELIPSSSGEEAETPQPFPEGELVERMPQQQRLKMKFPPVGPSAAEYHQHELTHLPYQA